VFFEFQFKYLDISGGDWVRIASSMQSWQEAHWGNKGPSIRDCTLEAMHTPGFRGKKFGG